MQTSMPGSLCRTMYLIWEFRSCKNPYLRVMNDDYDAMRYIIFFVFLQRYFFFWSSRALCFFFALIALFSLVFIFFAPSSSIIILGASNFPIRFSTIFLHHSLPVRWFYFHFYERLGSPTSFFFFPCRFARLSSRHGRFYVVNDQPNRIS